MKRHESVSATTVRRLREIIAVIKHDPDKFDMGEWGYKYDKRKTQAVKNYGLRTSSCGTVGCIAGWAIFLNMPKAELRRHLLPNGGSAPIKMFQPDFSKDETYETLGMKYLEIPRDQASRLFYTDNWPIEFLRAFNSNYKPAAQAVVAIQRIEHYIATGR